MTRRAESDLSDPLADGLCELGVQADAAQIERLSAYVDMLIRWNRAHGLTVDASRNRLLTRHILDSAAALPFLPPGPGPLLDAGSGGGLPGMVLALLRPDAAWVLLDSSARKAAFLRHARSALGLRNVRVVRSRLEEYDPAEAPGALIARALAPLPRLVDWASRPLRRGALLVAMLGRRPSDAELLALDQVDCRALGRVRVPGLDAQRHIAVFGCREVVRDRMTSAGDTGEAPA